MPFDAYVHRSLPAQHSDALRNMGVVPVSSYKVRRHKLAVATHWKLQHQGEPAVIMARWQTILIPRNDLYDELTRPLTRYRTNDVSPAPSALIDLAMKVDRRIEDATFRLSYFDTDPILYVSYNDRNACLGIWNDGEIVAIASAPSKWRKAWWSICFG